MLSLEAAVRLLCPDWRSPQDEFDEMTCDPELYLRIPRDITNIIKAYAFHGLHPVLHRVRHTMPDIATVFPESFSDERAEFHVDGQRCWAILRAGRLARENEICRVFDYKAWRNDRKVMIIAERMANHVVYRGGRVECHIRDQMRVMILVGNRIVVGSHEPCYHIGADMDSYYYLECGCTLRMAIINYDKKYYLETYDRPHRTVKVISEPALWTLRWT